jgi:hypothetical protein
MNKKKSYLPDELHKNIIEEIAKNNVDVIAGYCFSNGRSLNEILKDLPDKIKASCFAGSEEECEDMKTQNDSLICYPMTKHIYTETVLSKIKSEDFNGYKKLVPKVLHNFFYKMKNEITFNE